MEEVPVVRYGGIKSLPNLTREVLRMEDQLQYVHKQLRTQQEKVQAFKNREALLKAQVSNMRIALEKAPSPSTAMNYQDYVTWYKTQRAYALESITR